MEQQRDESTDWAVLKWMDGIDFRLWKLVELAGIAAAVFALYLAAIELNHNRINTAWQIVALNTPGNSGKISALETLNQGGHSLNGINLACDTDSKDRFANKCLSRTYLVGANLPKAKLDDSDLSGAEISEVNFSDSSLWRSKLNMVVAAGSLFHGANFSWAEMRDANFVGSDFRKSIMFAIDASGSIFDQADFTGATLSKSNLSNADFKNANLSGVEFSGAELFSANFQGANLSNAVFCNSVSGIECAKGLTQFQISGAWAWADQMPRFASVGSDFRLGLQPPVLCSPDERSDYFETSQIGIPLNCID